MLVTQWLWQEWHHSRFRHINTVLKNVFNCQFGQICFVNVPDGLDGHGYCFLFLAAAGLIVYCCHPSASRFNCAFGDALLHTLALTSS